MLVGIAFSIAAVGQQRTGEAVVRGSKVEFDVVSVKPQKWTGQGSVGVFVRGDTLDAEHTSLKSLVLFAYNFTPNGRTRTDMGLRTTIDIPAPVYRRLKEQAARQGCSVRELVSRGIEQVLLKLQQPTKRVTLPLIRSQGPKVRVTNQRIHELIEFPLHQYVAGPDLGAPLSGASTAGLRLVTFDRA